MRHSARAQSAYLPAAPHATRPPPSPAHPCSSTNSTTLNRLASFEVRVGDVPGYSPANTLCLFVSPGGNDMYNVVCAPPLVGRYVSVRLPSGYTRVAGEPPQLQLCEVQVYVTLPMVSVGRPAFQNSTAVPGTTDAGKAVDGGVNAYLAGGSCTRTNAGNKPWW